MPRLREFASRLRALFTKGHDDAELGEEIQVHLDLLVDEYVRRGLSSADARAAARREFGGIEQIKEVYREQRGLPVLDVIAQDVRYAVRTLRRHRTFTSVAVGTLALGIGVNTALFSIVNAVLLRPLPFPDSQRLVQIAAARTNAGGVSSVASYPDFEDWRAESTAFAGMAAFTARDVALTSGNLAERVAGLQATPDFFEVLNVAPVIGRTFRPEDVDGGGKVVVLSDAVWKRHFAGSTDALGQTVRIEVWPTNDEEAFTVIGVMPPGFSFSVRTPEQIYTPLLRDPNRNHSFLRALGRLGPGVSPAAAQAEMEAIAGRIAERYPASNRNPGAQVIPLLHAQVGNTRTGLLIFLGVVGLVLLIACTNVANLMLARNMSRRHELALRGALGAGRRRLIQQLLTESVVLAVAGGVLGVLLASWTGPLLAATLAQHLEIPRIENARIDVWVLTFTLVVSLATAMLFGSVHAFPAASPDLNESLRDGTRTDRRQRTRTSYSPPVDRDRDRACTRPAGGCRLAAEEPSHAAHDGAGRDGRQRADGQLLAPESGSRQCERAIAILRGCSQRRAKAAGHAVRGAGRRLAVERRVGLAWLSDPRADRFIRPGARGQRQHRERRVFRTIGTPVRAGREFTTEDSAGTPGVIVINETAARRFWPGEDPLGKQITLSEDAVAGTLTVVGVAGDVRQMGLGEPARPEIFLNYMQPGPSWPWLVLVVRTVAAPMALAGPIRSIARSVDPRVPILEIRTLDDVLSGSLGEPQVYALLLGVFAALALVLAAVGLYGVVSYTVTERTHEMGVRMALGAVQGDVVRLVLGQGLALVVAGAAIGLGAALFMTRFLTSLVPSAVAGDPLTLSAVTALLLGVAFLAAYLPARRASRVDPIKALRYE